MRAISKHYEKIKPIIPHVIWVLLVIFPVVVFVLSLMMGKFHVTTTEVCRILLSKLIPYDQTWTALAENIVVQVRLPRAIAAMLVGAGLAVSGAVFQGLFRNPLASPYTLGVSNGAGFGAALAILLLNNSFAIQVSAMIFSLVAVGLTFLFSLRAKNSTITMVLGGVIVGSLFSALVSLIKFVADPFEKLPAIVFWLMGSLSAVNTTLLLTALPLFVIFITVIWLFRWRLNVLSLGDEEAKSYGVDVRRDRIIIIVCCSILTAAAVSISGVIGWVGLVIPHLGRMLVGPDFRKLLPACICLGASYLLLIDDLCRTLTAEEIPLGVITAIVGTPLFAYFMFREKVNW
ncbi:iron ABC transporter permease [Paenibacillus kribbensis]|uniref:Iron ABC transporter permease n=1 Tax=Paenibacillus kribbensis TaxID=172713 RepID=A0A222WI11_9BACL|nr:iron ABC transporter permease [Paenibacillus kribbensis]ASR46047.1 iron ABC transporter permease [Paenibacillus kribbensis]